jgi:light-harvesting protein B-800-850 alpha chain
MNNAKIWLVVKPTVGIPLFLSAVAIGSFAVHVAVLTNTSWVGDYLSGQPLGAGDQAAALFDPDAPAANTASVVSAPAAAAGKPAEMYVVMPDGTRARLVIEENTTVASLSPDGPPQLDQ